MTSEMVQIELVIKFLLLLGVANGTPIFAARILGSKFARPIDGGMTWWDGRAVFGASKTVRGIVVALLFTLLAALILGLSPTTGLIIAATSMAGDLLSSFIKRRLGLAPSSRATGLDQIPESLLPALVGIPLLGFHYLDVIAVVALFLVGGLLLSQVLYRLKIRKHPY